MSCVINRYASQQTVVTRGPDERLAVSLVVSARAGDCMQVGNDCRGNLELDMCGTCRHVFE